MDLGNAVMDVIPSMEGRVLQVLARTYEPLSGTRVAKFIPSATREGVRLALNRLVAAGLVDARPVPPAIVFTANREHLLWPAIAQLMSDVDQVVHLLRKRISTTIIREVAATGESDRVSAALFGSVARDDARPDSDVDLLIVMPDELGEDATEQLVAALIDDVQAATGNHCNVYAATRSRFDHLVAAHDPMVASWQKDAVVLHGPDIRRRLRGAPWDDA
jgi:predicted nucleotidyltransferase